jgi:hypothetical protein
MYESDTSHNIYGGNSMPFSNGGLIPQTCMSCLTQNYDNYEIKVSDMCQRTIEDASYRCEENMERTYSYYYGKITSGCSYLTSKVSAIASSSSSVQGSLFGEQSFGGRGETAQIVIIFLTAAFVSAGLGLFCFQKRRAQRKARQAAANKDGLELITPAQAMETIQKGQQSAKEVIKSAAKKVKNSVHETAKKIVDLTRSTSNAVKKRAADKDDDEREDGTYKAMEEKDGLVIA